MKTVKICLLVSGIYELFLGTPIIGNILIWEYQPFPMIAACIVHILTLSFCIKQKGPKFPSVLAILSLSISWLPLIGWGVHMFVSGSLITSAIMIKKEIIK